MIHAHACTHASIPYLLFPNNISVVMADDLAKLPGDDDLEPKRRGLRRLRKAERAFLKQQQQQKQAAAAATSQPGGGRKKSIAAAAAAAAGAEETGVPPSTDSRGKGRQWDSRRWRASGLSDLARVVLAAAIATTATGEDSTPTAVDFSAVMDGLTADAAKVVEEAGEEKSAVDAAAAASPGHGASSKGGRKGKGAAAKGKEAAKRPTTDGEGEDEEATAARRQKEEREAGVKAWAEELREALEGETFVTTAHRAAVTARDSIILGLADRSKVEILFVAPPARPSAGAGGLHSKPNTYQ